MNLQNVSHFRHSHLPVVETFTDISKNDLLEMKRTNMSPGCMLGISALLKVLQNIF